MTYTVRPVGFVRSDRTDPGDSDYWGGVRSVIEMSPECGTDCLRGLEDFSHVEILFLFHQTTEHADQATRRPRGRADLPEVGVFAGRGPRRPNRIGATICPIVEVRPARLTVTGLDAVDGTPVLDVKPVLAEFLPGQTHQPAWATTLMAEYFRDRDGT